MKRLRLLSVVPKDCWSCFGYISKFQLNLNCISNFLFCLLSSRAYNKKTFLPIIEAIMSQTILDRCEIKGLRMTNQRKIIAEIIENSFDHPDVEELYNRASAIDDSISIATVYRTVKLFEESGILEKLEFGDGRARYENADREHHDHLIDINSGKVIEFVDNEIEKLQELIALRLGYELRGHKLELYGVPIKKA